MFEGGAKLSAKKPAASLGDGSSGKSNSNEN